jgi:F-type H+-transporting ATPase subunit b
MNLQWDILLTQAVGFLIVMWLLRKFAWGKLLAFLEKRRETIAAEFDEIEKEKGNVEELREKFEKELADIETTRRIHIQEAAQEANKLAADIKEEARQETVALRVKTKQDIELELDKANVALRDQIVNAVITSSEKIIKERLDSDKHKQLISDFLKNADLRPE